MCWEFILLSPEFLIFNDCLTIRCFFGRTTKDWVPLPIPYCFIFIGIFSFDEKMFFFSGSSIGSNFVVRKQIETFQLLKYLQRHRTISYHSSCEFGLKVLVKMLVFFLYQVEGGVKSLLTVSCILVFCATQSRSRIDQRMEERSKYDKVKLCSSYFHTKTFIPATTHIFSLRRTEEAVIKQRNIYIYYYNNLDFNAQDQQRFLHIRLNFFP